MGFESLEGRRLLALITWTGGAGTLDWGTAGNWLSDTNTAVVPGASDDVIIPSLAGSQTITIASGTRAARTIQVGGDEKLRITGGTLTVSAAEAILKGTGSFEVAGGTLALAGNGWSNTSTLVLASGTLNLGGSFTQPSLGSFVRSGGTVNLNGTLDGDLTLNASTGSWSFGGGGTLRNAILTADPGVDFQKATGSFTFDNVTIAAGVDVRMAFATGDLTVVNGLVLNGRMLLSNGGFTSGRLDFRQMSGNGTQAITGNGRIEFNNDDGGAIHSTFSSPATGGTLEIGPGITLAGQRATFGGNGSLVLKGSVDVVAGASSSSVNIEPNGVNSSFTNEGTIRLISGSLNIRPSMFRNTAGGVVVATGGNLGIGRLNHPWINEGSIQVSGTNVALGGDFTQVALGNFQRSSTQPGTVTLVGRILGDLELAPSTTGSWNFGGDGRLTNSTLTVHPSVQFRSLTNSTSFSSAFTFENVTIPTNSLVTVAGNDGSLSIVNSLTLNGVLEIGSGSNFGVLLSDQRTTDAEQTIFGTGRIVSNNSVGNMIRSVFNSPATSGGRLVIGSGIRVESQRLRLDGTNGSIVLAGTLTTVGAGADINIENNHFINHGTVRLVSGTVNIRPTQFVNSITGQVITTGGNLLIGGTAGQNRSWVNQGLIQIQNTIVSLGGNFTQAGIGNFQRSLTSPGTVNLVGNLDGGLVLNANTGAWTFGGGGRLRNGTLTVAPGVTFRSQDSTSFTFDNVVIPANSVVTVSSNSGTLFVSNSLILHGEIRLGLGTNFGILQSDQFFSGNEVQTISGSGRIVFSGHQSNAIRSTRGTLVIGSDITVSGPIIRIDGSLGTVALNGTIDVSGAGQIAVVDVNRFENRGTLRASNSAMIELRPSTLVNLTEVVSLGNNVYGFGFSSNLEVFAATLSNGAYELNGGTIRLFQGPSTGQSTGRLYVIRKLEAELSLAGLNSRIYGHPTNTISAIGDLAEIGAGGHLILKDGANFGTPGQFLVHGQLDVDAASRFGLDATAPISNDGLKSHFAADGNGSNSADGAETITATRIGATFASGVEGQGFLFDGIDDYVTIPADESLNNSNLTVSAWYRLDQLVAGQRFIFGKPFGAFTQNSYAVWMNGDSIRYGVNASQFSFSNIGLTRQVGKWNHIALTFSETDSSVRLYHNGTLLQSPVPASPPIYDNSPHIIGADIENGSPNYFFPGVIDEVRHYDRALSASEIFNIAANSPGLTTRVRQVDGEVRVGGSLASYGEYRLEGGRLLGSGTLPTNLNQLGGMLAPGNSPGCMEIDGDYNLEAAGTLQIEIDGPAACSQHDRLIVNGSVTLAGMLDVVLDPSYSPTVGQKFLVVENDLSDSIVGQFQYAGSVLRERQVFLVNGNQLFRISYTAGDGNDVELEFLGKGVLVSNASDSGPGSLRQAVEDANASPGHDLIAFAIADSLQVNGRYLIDSAGLAITDTITINGTTQYDFSGSPRIELRDQVGDSATGIEFAPGAENSELRGLSFTAWTTGVLLAEGASVAGNYFGIPLDGSAGGGNRVGIAVAPSLDSQVLIGGTTFADRNVIANSTTAGIDMSSVSNAVVQGNYIGTDPSGLIARPNQRGIYIFRNIAQAADNNLIGGTEPGAGNLISGNTIAGIEIDANGNFMDGNQIVGNWIGVDSTGDTSLANGIGVVLANSTSTSVSQNIISGNNTHGVLISGSSQNTIAGNIIGLNAAGTAAIPNLNHGIAIENGSENNIIGGLNAAERNIISGNGLYGVSLVTSDGNRILGNYLGTDSTGEIELTNGFVAIGLDNSNFTAIGSSEGNINANLIVGASAGQTGIAVENQSNNNGIVANRLGLSASNLPLGYLGNAIAIRDSDQNVIGGATSAERNVLVQYSSHGIVLDVGSESNIVVGNYIGVHPNGQSALFTEQHSTYGIAILNSSNNSIGLAVSGTGNLVGGNQFGVYVAGAESVGNSIDGNWIGLTAAGTATIPNEFGILVADARNTSIGANAPNIISGNRIGIEVSTAATRDTMIANNRIGTNGAGVTVTGTALGNSESGIRHVGGVRILIRNNTIVASGPFGPLQPEAPGAVQVLAGDAILSQNQIFNNYVRSIRTDAFPGTVTITQARLDGFVLGEVSGATPFTTFTVEFFEADDNLDGNYVAERFVGSGFLVTDEDGNAEFEISDLGDLTPGKFITATITGAITEGDSNFNTSAIGAGAIPQVALIRGLPSRSPEGTPINLQAFAVDSTIKGFAITGYVWEVLRADEIYATGNEAAMQFSPDDEGDYTVSLKLTLTNIAGVQQTVVLGPHDIDVFNVAPTPQFELTPGRATIGQSVLLQSSSSDPGRDDLLLHTWEVRSGSPTGPIVFSAGPSTELTSTSLTPTSGGNLYARLIVDDQDGGLNGARSMLRLLQVNGAPSSTSIIVPSQGSEGQTIRASAPESELQRADELTFTWQVLKNGSSYTFESPAVGVIEFTPDDDGTYAVSLTVSDGPSNIVAPTQNVLVSNASPVVSVQGFDGIAAVGQTLNLTADIFDPGSADTHQVSWIVERSGTIVETGSSNTEPWPLSFTPTQPGVYKIIATATDDDFDAVTGVGRATGQKVIYVAGANPSLAIQNPSLPGGGFIEGTDYPFTAVIPSLPPGITVEDYRWSALDRIGRQIQFVSGNGPVVPNYDFVPPSGGEFLAVLELVYSDGQTAQAVSQPITVQGLAPQISSIDLLSHASNQQVFEGELVRLRTNALGAGERVGLNYLWEMRRPGEVAWSVVPGVARRPSEMQFTPLDDGVHEIQVTVSDSEGLSVTQQFSRFSLPGINVLNALPLVQLRVLNNTGSNVTFSAQATDPGALDQPGLQYSWSVNNVNGGAFSLPSPSNTFTASLGSLSSLTVRVSDDTGFTEVQSYLLLGTNGDDTATITATDAANAITAGADQLVYLGLDGDDSVTVAAGITLPVVVFGGEGNDTINASAATLGVTLDGGNGDDILIGGSGNDRLIAGPGTNVLDGGNGNNVFIGGGNDTMTGGTGDDYYFVHFSTVVINDTAGGNNTIDLSLASQAVTFDFGSNTGLPQPVFTGSTLAINGNFETLVGSPYNDTISTNRSGTTLRSGGGNDRLIAGAIDVTLDGGAGNSELVLANASGTFIGGSGGSTIVGTLAANTSSTIELREGGGSVHVVGGVPTGTTSLAKVTIAGGDSYSSIQAERVSGKIYAGQGFQADQLGAINEFGAPSAPAGPLNRTITVNNSSDIDIFGSARPGNTIVVTQSQDIDIFGTAGDSAQLSNVIRGTVDASLFGTAGPGSAFTATVTASSDIDIFGSARPQSALVSTINNSSDIDIFGSARSNSQVTVRGGQDIDIFGVAEGSILFAADDLGNSPTRATVRISDFGSATPRSLPITITSSQEIDIFGSASPTGTPLTATIDASSDIDIFGVAARATSIDATNSSDIDIFGVLDGDIRLGPADSSSTLDAVTRAVIEASGFGATAVGGQLNVTVHNSSEIDIFGGVSPNSATLTATVINSSDIDIFGSVRGGTIQATSSQDIDIYGQGSDTITLTDVDRAAVFTQVFGSTTPRSPLQVSIVSNSSDIDIFGSANRNARIEVTSSSDIDIFGGTAQTELAGVTTWGDEVLLSGVERARIVAGVFGSAAPSQTIMNLTVSGNSSDIDIFGSGLGRSQVAVRQSQDIDIFGAFGDTISLDDVERVRIEGGLFGAATAGVRGLTTTVVGNSQDIDIFGTSTDDLVEIFGGLNYRLALRDGEDELQISDVQNLVAVLDEGDDAVTVNSGSNMLLYMAGGQDRAELRGGENIRFIGGDGSDQFLVTGGQQVDIDGGSGDDLVVLVNGTSTIVRLDQGANDLRMFGGAGALAVGGSDSDRMTVYGKLGNTLSQGQVYALLDGGDGDDQLSVLPLYSADDPQRDPGVDPLASLPSWMNLPQQITSPTSTTFASSVALVGGAGNDTLTLSGNQRLFAFGGAGADQVTLMAGSTSTISGGDGDDSLQVFSPGLNNYVFGGEGDDQVIVYRGTKVGVFTESGDDQVTFDSIVDPVSGIAAFAHQSFARGGFGNDHFSILAGIALMAAGEVGRNTIEVLGGQNIVGGGGSGNDTLRALAGVAIILLGEGGNDDLQYHGGTDVILSGGDGDDRLSALKGAVQLYGDDGDDWYTLGDFEEEGKVLIRELIFLDGQSFEADARGSDTIDLSGVVVTGETGATLDLRALDIDQTVIPGKLVLKLLGAVENVLGTSGNDTLYGNDEANRLDGGAGNDRLFGLGGDDILVGGDGHNTLVGGNGSDHYLIQFPTGTAASSQRIIEGTGQGIDRLDFASLPVGLGQFSLSSNQAQSIAEGMISVTLQSIESDLTSPVGEIEELTGTRYDDFVIGNSLDNRFEMLDGNDTVDGAGGDDLYIFAGSRLGTLVLQDAATNPGRRTLDFAAFDAPLDIDLAISTPQNLGDQWWLTLVSPLAFHNVVGTSFDDQIFGNANDNALYGAAGRDHLDGREGNDRIYGDLPQVVLLDFETAFRAERGDYAYTPAQREEILALVASRFLAFNWRFTLDEAEAKAWTRDSGRTFVRLNFSEGRGGGVSGDAGEIDFRNVNRGLVSQVNINSLKASLPAILTDMLGRTPTVAEIDNAIVHLSAHIAAHELGHTAGLRHADALGPIGSGFYVNADLSQIYPPYSGPLNANETRHHLIASPASLGTTIADALGATFWGARESIKLAFNEQGRTVREASRAFNSHTSLNSSAEDLGELSPLYVPNLAPSSGHTYSGSVFEVSAIAVIGHLASQTNGSDTLTERDVYRFTGRAGEWVNIEAMANGIRPMRGGLFDGQVKLFNSDGLLIGWNDDEFEGTKDAVLFDAQLPEDGEYFIEVSLSDEPAIDAPGDRYELFVSRFRLRPGGSPLPSVPGDTFIGGLGEDEMHGSPADDLFLATQAGGVDTIFGNAGFDTLDILGLDYQYDPELLESIEQIINDNIAPTATLTGVPENPVAASTPWTVSLVNPSDPSPSDTAAGFRYAFALKRLDGSIAQGSLPLLWSEAGVESNREFSVSQPGSYTLVARIFDVRNGYRDYEASVSVEGSANQPPTDILIDNTVIAENLAAGAVVGNLSVVDPEIGESHQFELVEGSGDTDNSAFEIVGNQLRAKQAFDFEIQSSYSIRVQVRDSADNTFAKSLTITVGNAPELIGAIVVGDGTVQRSLVKQLSLLFDTQLQIDEGAFIVQRRDFNTTGDLMPTNVPIQVAQVLDTDGRYRVVISFVFSAGSITVRQGSLALQDGNYQLLINGGMIRSLSSEIAFDADGDGTAGGPLVFGNQLSHGFYSFFGDVRGLRVAGAFENNEFRKTLNKLAGMTGFDSRFDADGNGAIGAFDNNQMRSSLLKRVFNWR